jgi:hypothetical protein
MRVDPSHPLLDPLHCSAAGRESSPGSGLDSELQKVPKSKSIATHPFTSRPLPLGPGVRLRSAKEGKRR